MSKESELVAALTEEVTSSSGKFDIAGLITSSGLVYPLGTDTKVLSTAFELALRPTITSVAERYGYQVEEPRAQNFYPDFTLKPIGESENFIAFDVKTTYRKNKSGTFSFTLGGYTSFIRKNTPTKNIVYSFERYISHYVVGFVYTREVDGKSGEPRVYDPKDVGDVVLPYSEVDVFVQEKWRIAGDVAGSGNTTNIGSIVGNIDDFRSGCGIFKSEREFLNYWRSYGRTAAIRNYSNIEEFRNINAT
ncbi:MAG: restriction endonuclease [Erythrobacter sp.]|nr:restriction endonuclease [Erythrobacter sp.]